MLPEDNETARGRFPVTANSFKCSHSSKQAQNALVFCMGLGIACR